MTAVESRPAVATHFRRLFEPLRIGTFEVRNRIVNTTHGTALGEARDIDYLRARARGGVGLMGLHASHGVYSYALGPAPYSTTPDWDQRHPSPLTAEGIAHFDDAVIPGLRRRAQVIQAEGARCFGQVFHLGAAPHVQGIAPPLAPSAVSDPYDALTPHPLSEEEIGELVFAYAHAIRRVAEAGLDAAEIHGAHGYLVNQFLSPYFNRRSDRWGGARENRVRFPLAIVAAARELVGPSFPIGIRVGVDGDGVSRGLTIAELAECGRLIGPHVAWISVSGGSYSGLGDGFEGAYVSPWYREPAFNAPAAAAMKRGVDVPVFVTGRVVDPAIAEGLLADGAADMVGMVRALIADPDLPRKAREGRADEVRMCLGMSECHYIGAHRVPMTCAVNAAAGRESEMEIRPAAVARTVLVVGAGPAGMEAARVAALRGHRVFLCDRERALGGTPRILARDPNRRNLRDHAVYFETELRKLGVELLLGDEVTAETVVEFAPDAVVVATGGVPLIPDVPGIDSSNVVTGLAVLRGDVDVSGRVVVAGGLDSHIGAPTIAEYLADLGCEVEYLSEQMDFAHGAEDGTRLPLMHRMLTKGVRVSLMHRLVSVDGGGVTVMNTFTRGQRRVDDATVVLACGLIPDDRLARELKGRVGEVHLVGDGLAPRRMMHATLEGARVGQAL
ncbi:MAG TPA: FAD-dependent oxidoreductase [Candidatus Dormibacteraeota bacterium]|jgi:2,4-dienoyl-CoA reductase-like NADH-dependent reductase (Old Yellow Enzyme family)/thioredoxin reductase|nr:FAD-dependent oxidoreductase [Candidatus Dormibacteraeota bacterium]